ncbi:hypothetical protein FQR65_LT12242 [Abscondita terminalis]|nr:hypothetical protein FQR65_LT12242 [Abscondita terminalis]
MFSTSVVFFLTIGSFCVDSKLGLSERIINGQDAIEGQFPYQVSLRTYYPKRHFCGGSIIKNHWVLTAAHCFKGLHYYYVAVGSIYRTKGIGYDVVKEIRHPLYSSAGNYDIGLIRTKTSIEYSATVQPIRLPSVAPGERVDAVVSGWGLSNYTKRTSPFILKWFITSTIPQYVCQKYFKIDLRYTIRASQFCSITNPSGICLGDSGGPLVADGIQIGVISKTIPCAVGYPDIYTNVTMALDWIYSHTTVL